MIKVAGESLAIMGIGIKYLQNTGYLWLGGRNVFK